MNKEILVGYYIDENGFYDYLTDQHIKSLDVYKNETKTVVDEGREMEVLDIKKSYDVTDITLKKKGNKIEVYCNEEIGEHFIDENSLIVKSEPGTFFHRMGMEYHRVILKESKS